jgi:hypothetical protein
MNEPFVGMYSAEIRADLEKAGFGFRREVDLIERAAARNLLAFAWAFSPGEARIFVRSGAHVIGAMLGPSRRDAAGVEEALSAADAIAEAALAINPDVIVLGHGGPLTALDAVRSFLMRSRCHGYASGSSVEGEPVPSPRPSVSSHSHCAATGDRQVRQIPKSVGLAPRDRHIMKRQNVSTRPGVNWKRRRKREGVRRGFFDRECAGLGWRKRRALSGRRAD